MKEVEKHYITNGDKKLDEFVAKVEDKVSLEQDMERNPEQYKEYVEDVKPNYPTHGGYMLVDHQNMNSMQEKPCFHNVDEAVQWAEYNLDHNNYNVYQLKTIL